MTNRDNDRLDFWNSRAALGFCAGTNDFMIKRLEIEAIGGYAQDGMKILDFGCGNGVTAMALAKQKAVDLTGLDYAAEMIGQAVVAAEKEDLKGSVSFEVADHLKLSSLNQAFDLVYTERCLINLPTWDDQKKTIADIISLLKPGGRYIMCESSRTGLDEINRLRGMMDLELISQPWHNLYFVDDLVSGLSMEGCRLAEVNEFSATYYFLSRVVNAALARADNREPRYDDRINLMSMHLPVISSCAQTKIWVWEKLR